MANNGEYVINPQDFHRKKQKFAIDLEIGLVTVNFSNPSASVGILYAP